MFLFTKRGLLLAGLLSLAVAGRAQSRKALDKIQTDILQDGLALYQMERASWVGTDLLMADKPDMSQLKGYVSYIMGDSVRCVFFRAGSSEQAPPLVQYSYTFPRNRVNAAAVRTTTTPRPVNAVEQRKWEQRLAVKDELATNQALGSPYRLPAKTALNIVLLDKSKTTYAYLLTGPQTSGLVPIGNDFLLTLDSKTNKVKLAERLHNSYLPLGADTIKHITSIAHTHLPAHPYITPSDICSTLLYHDQVPAQQHYVMGKGFISLLDMNQAEPRLIIFTKEAWDRMNSH